MHRFFLVVPLTVSTAIAADPGWAVQTRIVDADGAPINGQQTIAVRVVDDAAGTNELYSQTFTDHPVADGYAAFVLGQGTGLPAAVYAEDSLWLEFTVDSVTLTPRTPVQTVPWSARADRAGGLGDGTVGADVTATGVQIHGDLQAGGLTVDGSTITVTDPLVVSEAMQFGGRYMLSLSGSSCTDEDWVAVIANERSDTYMSFKLLFSHCGGGCHTAARTWEGYFNAYDDMYPSFTSEGNLANGGHWTIQRVVTGSTSNGPHSNQTRLTKQSDPTYHFCGPVNVWVESNRPISVVSETN